MMHDFHGDWPDPESDEWTDSDPDQRHDHEQRGFRGNPLAGLFDRADKQRSEPSYLDTNADNLSGF